MNGTPAMSGAETNSAGEYAMELTLTRKGRTIKSYQMDGKRITVGRSPHSDICIGSRYLSWKHAIIGFDRDGPFVADLCSKNKTFLNGDEIERASIREGDIISLGFHRIHISSLSTPGVTIEHGDESGETQVLVDDEVEETGESERKGSVIDTSADGFREFADTVLLDEDMLAEELDTQAMEDAPWAAQSVNEVLSEVSVRPESNTIECADVEKTIVSASEESRDVLEALGEQFGEDEEQLTRVLGEIFDYRTLNSHELMKLTPDFESLSLAQSREQQCVLALVSDKQTAIICDPFDQNIRPWMESRFPGALQWVLVSPGNMSAFIARQEQSTRAMDSAIQTTGVITDSDSDIENLSLASISQDSSPVVKLVHSTLYDALRAGASDIHMESGNGALEIRYRIDGVLAHVANASGTDIAEQVISRIKVMSELDIAERRIPQDGRFKSAYEGRAIDFRVSIMPSSYGEDAVLRVLDKQAVTDQMTELSLDSLGFASCTVESLRKLSDRPYGMLLVTGPTGSGKTTTLYGAISETNSGLGKIVTIEDPVEYQLPGVLQIPVNEKKGLTFARGLRSILRHDPDKIMVGEIRDPETAQIAIQSALTGHLVFTTVHANNVFDVLSRFLHMGVDAYSFVSALNGILAQRLLRIVCQNCGEKIEPTREMLEATGEPLELARSFNWRAGEGCGECRGTGYRGRKAVGELLVLDDELREAIIGRAPVRKLKELAQAGGVQFIRTAALNLVRDGLTTMEEVDRVTTMA